MQHAVDRAIALVRAARAQQDSPHVVHVSALGGDEPARDTVAFALDAISRALRPLAVTFFRVGADDEIASSVVHASHLPPAEVARQVRTWKATLGARDPLAPRRLPAPPQRIATLRGAAEAGALDPQAEAVYRHLGVANDARLLVRDGGRVVAGVTLWRSWSSRPWCSAELRLLRTLQPLVEMAYLAQLTEAAYAALRLPSTLTCREREVARVLMRGATNAELARALQLSPNTAKTHTRAVLAKLGVGSRRELVARLAEAPARAPRPPRREPGDPLLWIEGTTTTQQQLLVPLLGWASEHVGAAAGGFAALSARGSLVADAYGTPHPGGQRVDRARVHELQEAVLSRAVVERLVADPAQPAVAPLDALVRDGERERVAALVAQLGLATPLVTALRRAGRVAALAWVAGDASAAAGARDAARELRCLRPLLELAYAPHLGEGRPRADAARELAALPLTPRQREIARMALAGAGNDEIARALRVAPSTVKNHMTRILATCELQSRTQLIATFGAPRDD